MASESADELSDRQRQLAYRGPRPDVLAALAPSSPSSVLDVGCSDGSLGLSIIDRFGTSQVTGIEIDEAACRLAAERLHRVIEADAADAVATLALEGASFDAIVFADSLEHMRDPWSVLAAAADGLLEPGGVVVISVPNVGHWTTSYNVLVKKRWPRRSRGLFDATHLRWFGERDVENLVRGSGLQLREIKRKPRIADGQGLRINRLSSFAVKLWPTAFTYQFLATAEK